MERGIVIVRGGGDIATGIIQKLHRAHLRVLVLETAEPVAIRRSVALCEAVRLGEMTVEDITGRRVVSRDEMEACFLAGEVPVAVDPEGQWMEDLNPLCVVDAILAKRNLGTHQGMAPVVIGVGPGFCAGQDVHAVVETIRGHDLGRLIFQGSALPNTGIPGELGGRSAERVIHAPASGVVRHCRQLGDVVRAGETLFRIGDAACAAPFDGVLRGLIAEGMQVKTGTKVADVDPRTGVDWQTISDKARCIGGAVLEAFLFFRKGEVML